MSSFDLVLHLSPAFHRPCTLRIGSEGAGSASLDAPGIGLLAHIAFSFPVAHASLAALHDRCAGMLAAWDARWSRPGLDGITVRGTFRTSDAPSRAFSLWSPRTGTVPHDMLAAALHCFPFETGDVAATELLELIRRYCGLQAPATIVARDPLRLRLAPWVHVRDAAQVEERVRQLPEDGALIVDASGVECSHDALMRILPIGQLLERRGQVRWVVPAGASDALIQSGVDTSAIDTVRALPITSLGEPVVLGDILVSSAELIALARSGRKVDVVRAFRRAYPLTIAQASQAADELLSIVAADTER